MLQIIAASLADLSSYIEFKTDECLPSLIFLHKSLVSLESLHHTSSTLPSIFSIEKGFKQAILSYLVFELDCPFFHTFDLVRNVRHLQI
jgi:hypothetical protein